MITSIFAWKKYFHFFLFWNLFFVIEFVLKIFEININNINDLFQFLQQSQVLRVFPLVTFPARIVVKFLRLLRNWRDM